MRRLRISFVAMMLLSTALGIAHLDGQMLTTQSTIEMSGLKPAMKFEALVEGFLKPLNGKLKMRATEVDFEPGAVLGDHYHVGPGIRFVLAGELSVVHGDTGEEQRVRQGGYFYETGDVSLRVYNRSGELARLLVVELLPATWQGTAMVPLARRADLAQEGIHLQKLLCQDDGN